jgi:large subunit ribosomal protein L27
MAHRKAGGTARNLRDSNPQYLGVKLSHGSTAKPGAIIIRQRGTYFTAGKNVGLGKDHTIFALTSGIVNFKTKRKTNYDSRQRLVKVVSVV